MAVPIPIDLISDLSVVDLSRIYQNKAAKNYYILPIKAKAVSTSILEYRNCFAIFIYLLDNSDLCLKLYGVGWRINIWR
jgi:hypothetical protein